ncbi:MAG: hypothetical protein JW700_01115 [Candidatus Aenigmarchaeota archaeon]|nr:hypothetical protein [Candidatus Aenigmarchaeota archaeon]
MIGLVNFNRPPANVKEARDMLIGLEDLYRMADISEKDYAEKRKRCHELLNITDKREDSIEKRKRESERKDVQMFIDSLEDQFRNGEINKEDYENIKNVNEERLKELDKVLEEDEKEVEIKVKKKKKGFFSRLFGKKENKVREERNETIEDGIETAKETGNETEDVKITLDGDTPTIVIEDVPKEEELVYVQDETKKEDEVIDMTDEIKEDEKPKVEKKGFFKKMFGKKDKNNSDTNSAAKEAVKQENLNEREETKENKIVEQKAAVLDAPKEDIKIEEQPNEVKAPAEKVNSEPEEKPKEEKPEEKKDDKKENKAETPEKKEEPEEKLDIDKIEEVTPEVIEKLSAQMAGDSAADVPIEDTEDSSEEESAIPNDNKLSIEIEKLKVMIDTFKESKKATDEAIQNISENIGEIRSMVMQADANFKTTSANMERLEDEVSDIKPKELTKKFNLLKEEREKDKLDLEKVKRKSEGSVDKVNEIYDMLKSIGGIENLIGLNGDIQKKIKDINEAIKYIQRIGTKTEKIFIDLSKGLEDLVMIKAKQEDFDESMRNVLTSIDTLNVKLKEYVSKEDLDDFKEENILIKKQIEEIKKILPVADLKLPEELIKLRKEKEDIKMFMDSLEMQMIEHKMNKAEYEEMKRLNERKLDEIRSKIEEQWKNIDVLLHPQAAKERVSEPKKEEPLEKEEKPQKKESEEKPKKEDKKTKKEKKKPKKTKKTKGNEDQKKKILDNLKELKV